MRRGALALLLWAASLAVAAAPDCAALHRAADAASAALLARVGEDGRFRYREDAAGAALPGYNLVRHAGALYALAEHPAAVKHPALERATRFLARSLRPVADWDGAAALWSDAEGHPRRAKLGASGLGLAAFAALRAQGAAAPPLADLQALGRFIVQMQDDRGHFHMRYVEGAGAQRRHSLYYPGEAALGLYRLSALDGDARWAQAADRALAALAVQRQRMQSWPPDHWALIAAAEATATPPEGMAAPLLAALVAEAQAGGALTADARTTPTATRLEGLLAALRHPPRLNESGVKNAKAAMPPALRWLLARQRADGTLRRGGTGPDAEEHRVDYTQHALSVFIGAARWRGCVSG